MFVVNNIIQRTYLNNLFLSKLILKQFQQYKVIRRWTPLLSYFNIQIKNLCNKICIRQVIKILQYYVFRCTLFRFSGKSFLHIQKYLNWQELWYQDFYTVDRHILRVDSLKNKKIYVDRHFPGKFLTLKYLLQVSENQESVALSWNE